MSLADGPVARNAHAKYCVTIGIAQLASVLKCIIACACYTGSIFFLNCGSKNITEVNLYSLCFLQDQTSVGRRPYFEMDGDVLAITCSMRTRTKD